MKTHAETVRDLIAARDPIAVTVSCGYMVTRQHERILFSDHYGDRTWSVPWVTDEKRSVSGRCTAFTAVYSDGSRLRYTWSDSLGPRWRVLEPRA